MPIEHMALKPTDIAIATRAMIEARQPFMVWGHPGVSKSSVFVQTIASMGYDSRDIRAANFDAVDLRGIPDKDITGNLTRWLVPDFWPQCVPGTRLAARPGVVILEELNRAPQSVQNALFQLVLDRRIGDYILPDNWQIVAACNYDNDGGGVNKLSAGLASRFVHAHMVVDLDNWCVWACANDVDPIIYSFHRWKVGEGHQLLHVFDPKSKEKAFPCPRTWEFASNIIKRNLPLHIERALLQGTVGEAAELEVSAYADLYRMRAGISIDGIIANPHGATVPTDLSMLYAVTASLGARMSDTNIGRIVAYLERLPEDFNVFAVRSALGRDKTLDTTPEFTNWCISHPNVIN